MVVPFLTFTSGSHLALWGNPLISCWMLNVSRDCGKGAAISKKESQGSIAAQSLILKRGTDSPLDFVGLYKLESLEITRNAQMASRQAWSCLCGLCRWISGRGRNPSQAGKALSSLSSLRRSSWLGDFSPLGLPKKSVANNMTAVNALNGSFTPFASRNERWVGQRLSFSWNLLPSMRLLYEQKPHTYIYIDIFYEHSMDGMAWLRTFTCSRLGSSSFGTWP